MGAAVLLPWRVLVGLVRGARGLAPRLCALINHTRSRRYYPFHYAPTASDLIGPSLLDIASKLSFQLGAPFAPFEQLLAVLPAGVPTEPRLSRERS